MSDNPDPEIIEIEEENINSDTEEKNKNMQCIFNWCIKNYSNCQLESDEEICSSIFTADSSSRWYLSLFPDGQTDKEYVSVCVIPLNKVETNQEKISCEISLLDSSAEKWHSQKSVQDVASLGRFEFETFVQKIALLTEERKLLPNDTLTICCQLCTLETTQSNDESLNQDTDDKKPLKRFSKDFKALFESGKFSDVTLTLKDGSILAHKVILTARSPEFARCLESPTVNDISIPNFEKRTMDSILSYIYTGGIDSHLSGGTLDLYQAAKKFGLNELERWITPNRIFAQTEVINEKYSYKWHIQNFLSINQNSGRMIYSSKFHTGPTEIWSLSLYFRPQEEKDEDDIGIYLNKLWRANEKKTVFVQFQIYVLDKNKQPRFKIEMRKNYKQTSRHGTPHFLKKSILLAAKKAFLPGDTLTICCDLNVSDGASHSKITHSFSSSTCNVSEINDINNLSECFRNLFQDEKNADVWIKCQSKKKFAVHKAILAARSPRFSNFLNNQDTNLKQVTIDISGIRPQILEQLFILIYTGEIENLSDETAPELYSAAKYYEIAEIEEIFSSYLQNNLTTENALKMMVLGMTMEDQNLTSSILDFICSHAEELINGPDWPNFMRDHPNESSEIVKCLANQYRDSKRRRLN